MVFSDDERRDRVSSGSPDDSLVEGASVRENVREVGCEGRRDDERSGGDLPNHRSLEERRRLGSMRLDPVNSVVDSALPQDGFYLESAAKDSRISQVLRERRHAEAKTWQRVIAAWARKNWLATLRVGNLWLRRMATT
jgi:hypothetical protein